MDRSAAMSAKWAALLGSMTILAAPAGALAQEAGAPQALSPQGVMTVQEAVEALVRSRPHGKSVPAKVLGDPGQYFGSDEYPPAAIQAQEQGRSIVRLTLDVRGFPTACSVVASSGSASLDAATCRIAQTRLQFSAARDEHGRSIASQYTLPVRWILPDDEIPPIDLTSGRVRVADTVVVFGVDEQGKAMTCKSVRASRPDGDACTGFVPGRNLARPSIINGQRSRSIITIETIVTADQPDPIEPPAAPVVPTSGKGAH